MLASGHISITYHQLLNGADPQECIHALITWDRLLASCWFDGIGLTFNNIADCRARILAPKWLRVKALPLNDWFRIGQAKCKYKSASQKSVSSTREKLEQICWPIWRIISLNVTSERGQSSRQIHCMYLFIHQIQAVQRHASMLKTLYIFSRAPRIPWISPSLFCEYDSNGMQCNVHVFRRPTSSKTTPSIMQANLHNWANLVPWNRPND